MAAEKPEKRLMADGRTPVPDEVTAGGRTYKPLADGAYDVIVCGTGLKVCILAGLMANEGKRVLIVDRNDYYGGEAASLNLTSLYKKFIDASADTPPEAFFKALGHNRDYAVDLVPKFIMADGALVKMLVKTGTNEYLEFKQIDGSFVYKTGGTVHKVPATDMEAVKTDLVGFFQKRKLRSFVQFVGRYDAADPATYKSFDPKTRTAADMYAHFGLDANTQAVVGHAMALYPDDSYLALPALPMVHAIKLYGMSLDKYGKSPYIYPLWGLGGLPESFSRYCAVRGGTFMLQREVDEVLRGADGKVQGIRCGDEAATAPVIIAEPSYVPAALLKPIGRVIRTLCILDHPVEAIGGQPSGQVIIPQSAVGRRNDIYLTVVSSTHNVASKGKYIAIASTVIETDKPADEVAPALALLGPTITRFDNISDCFAPLADGTADQLFVTASFDASSHFESTSKDVLAMYECITGRALALGETDETEAEVAAKTGAAAAGSA